MIGRSLPRLLLSALAPKGPKNSLSVFIFHRVLPERDPLFPSEPVAAEFETLVGWIKGWFNVLPLAEAVERLEAGSLPARPASITFDDGYADNVTVALPILSRLQVPVT